LLFVSNISMTWEYAMAKIGDHAVVMGASMAGLLAARTLSDLFETVTVVERDLLPDDAANRRGVPQGRHLHALLARGAQALEELFPGLLDELVTDGVPYFDGRDLSQIYYSLGGHQVVRAGSAESFTAYASSRPFLECFVRQRVQAIANVTLLDDHEVVELTFTPDHKRITGARIAHRRSGIQLRLAADLIVDATGRGARTPALLENLGYGRPLEDHVSVHLTYTSQVLRIRPGALHEQVLLIGPVPGRPTGMGLLACEHDSWLFTVFGMAGREAPRERAGMYAFVEEFAPPQALAAIADATPISQVAQHRVPSSVWRRYDLMRRFPHGLLVVGDAICSFNPIYGQGMTVAALEALALRDCLICGTDDLPRRFFRAARQPIRQAWQLAAAGDLALPEIEGREPLITRLFNGYVDRVLTAAEFDPVALNQFVRVTSLVDPATRLLGPGMLWRAAWANHRRRQYAHQSDDPTGMVEISVI
jgi:2-polyprenyl-6-methoxyphenol hydroxylase-like FAD-dependent oxidoreductase